MKKETDDILNKPIKPEDYKTNSTDINQEDLPRQEEDEIIDDKQFNIEDDEVDPIGDIGLDDKEFSKSLKEPADADLPNSKEETKEEPLEEPLEDMLDEPSGQKDISGPSWTVVPQENGEIKIEHKDGYTVRAKPLTVRNKNKIKYAVQLYKDHKIIEKGVRWIDEDQDPIKILQNISDALLKKLNFINDEDEDQ